MPERGSNPRSTKTNNNYQEFGQHLRGLHPSCIQKLNKCDIFGYPANTRRWPNVGPASQTVGQHFVSVSCLLRGHSPRPVYTRTLFCGAVVNSVLITRDWNLTTSTASLHLAPFSIRLPAVHRDFLYDQTGNCNIKPRLTVRILDVWIKRGPASSASESAVRWPAWEMVQSRLSIGPTLDNFAQHWANAESVMTSATQGFTYQSVISIYFVRRYGLARL